MDDDTRDSAAMVREAAAAAGALKGEAAHLAEVVAVFHLDRSDAPAGRLTRRGMACREGKLSSAGKVGGGAQLR
jgi:methyl-accepting chemotaxis protein